MAATGVWISWDKFVQFIDSFSETSDKNKDDWQHHVVEGKPFSAFLCKKVIQPEDEWNASLHTTDETVTGMQLEQVEETKDESSVAPTTVGGSITKEYHIVYSPSYSVPVLLFNCYRQDGTLLPIKDVWQSVPATYQEKLAEEKWSFLSQVEHPLLGRPFYQLHPCNTAHLMAQAPYNEDSNYIVSWLSAVGPVVGLNLGLSYADIKVDSTAQMSILQQDNQMNRLDLLMAHTMSLDKASGGSKKKKDKSGKAEEEDGKATKKSPNGGKDVVFPGSSSTIDQIGNEPVDEKDMSGLDDEELPTNDFENSPHLLACDFVEIFPESQELALDEEPMFPGYMGPAEKEEEENSGDKGEMAAWGKSVKKDAPASKSDKKAKSNEEQEAADGNGKLEPVEILQYPICVV